MTNAFFSKKIYKIINKYIRDEMRSGRPHLVFRSVLKINFVSSQNFSVREGKSLHNPNKYVCVFIYINLFPRFKTTRNMIHLHAKY